MKKRLLLFAAILLAGFTGRAQDSTFTINGGLDKVKDGTIFLNIYEGDKTIVDSTPVVGGNFKFSGSIQSPFFATLTMPDKRNDYYTFYIEPSTMSITGRGDSLKMLTVKGSKVNDDNRLFKDRMKNIDKWEENNSKIYEKAYKSKNTRVMDSLDEVDFNVLAEKRKVVAAFVKDYPQSMRGALAITEYYGYYAEAVDVVPLYDLLDSQVKNSAKGKEIKQLIDTYQAVSIGKMAPEITQQAPDGNPVSLSSLRGKYVLIDFWASWCGPCRRENPNVVAAYDLFKDKGFTIFSISYDTKKDKWKKAIEDDKLTWCQVSDLTGWKNSTSDQYGIKAIPSNLLLDKEGKIIAKNIFGKKLTDKLASLMP